ncbi:LacI family DNA-binding transcriptional regulator [Cryobacterium sp. SO1]|uniref:LacI family DNA-binding transcriptional regulator n=1 Tax=Cryobacterium sp. SO1 TaxID=1897061 RepID=UPI00102372D7|nr:LacI family DNA-binding transcriptional regulator [Cryobacterium sp. SO1]RZI37205.1 HTH-type transcriptional regulator DegA [Cryobacterium sp. SO1]
MTGSATKPWTRVTMADVAREARVSGATVSRVLEGVVPVTEETRAAVIAAIQRTGYIRNWAARQLASNTSDSVGLLLRDPRNPTYGVLHSELQSRAADHGLQLLTVSPSFDTGSRHERSGLHRLLEQRVSGILVATGVIPANDLVPFVSVVPTVVLGRPEDHPAINAVVYDEVSNGNLIADRVLEHGHRAIAVVVPPPTVSLGENRRATAIVARLAVAGVRAIVVATPTFATLNESSPALIRLVRDRTVTAVMFPTDMRQVAFLQDARDAGIRAPEEVSTTGMDGVMPGLGLLGLATVRMPIETLARRGMAILAEQIAAGRPTPPLHESYAGEFVPGNSLRRSGVLV